MIIYFDHEKLKVYQSALVFVTWSEQFMRRISVNISAKDHLDRASTSVVLNTAEGNGKYSVKDRCRFLEIARASALECAACLDIYVAKGYVTTDEVASGKSLLREIVCMMVKLIESLKMRIAEEGGEYLGESNLGE